MAGETWVVVPTYNEADNLRELVARVTAVLERAAPEGFRVLIVDDASPDGTGELAGELAAGDARVEVLHRARKEGLGPAYLAGFARALDDGAGFVIEMDADLSHDPADLPRLLEPVRGGEADVVLGSRYVPGGAIADWGPLRRAVSRAGCLYARAVLGVPIADLTGGYKCFSAAALRALDLHTVRARGYAFQVDLTYRALRRGLRVVEIPIVFTERQAGSSKMSPRIALEAFWRVPQLRLRGR